MSFSRARALCVVLRRLELDSTGGLSSETCKRRYGEDALYSWYVCNNVLCSLRHPNLTKTTDPTSKSAETLSIFRTFARNRASFFSGLSIVLCRACACVAGRSWCVGERRT